jgi:TRAP-type C4-dicarboxylate transport system permease small subunit
MMGRYTERFRHIAGVIAAWSLGTVFVLFMIGVAARWANRPIGWIDEAVTLLSVWSTFWTGAFVLRWPDYIAFDIVYTHVSEGMRRVLLLCGLVAFCALMTAALPGMVDYTMFLWRERTDAMLLRLDFVYAIFPIFFAVVVLRMLASVRRLLSRNWRAEIAHWAGEERP